MTGRPKPIRIDADTWIVMRNDPERPKAILERRRDATGADVFFILAWALDPKERVLMGTRPTLGEADDFVLYDLPTKRDGRDGPPNGIYADGVQRRV
jgi:hypothetical protein